MDSEPTAQAPVPNGSPKTIWAKGWLVEATQICSPNFDDRPDGAVVDLIVIHAISLPPGKFGGGEVGQLFTNQLDWTAHPYFESIRGLKVSAHFLVKRTGAIEQFVSCEHRAWHAGASTYRGRSSCNNDSIGIELEGLAGELFEPKQFEAVVQLCQQIATKFPIQYVAGHEHIAPVRKTDPGVGFMWADLQHSLAWPPYFFPTLTPGVTAQLNVNQVTLRAISAREGKSKT